MKIIFRLSNRRLDVSSNVLKIFVKDMDVSCGLVKDLALLKILDWAILDNSFKSISFFIPFYILFK